MADEYKFPVALRMAMRHTATVLTNLAHDKLRELDQDDQAAMRRTLDALDRLCAETGLAARSAVPAQASAAEIASIRTLEFVNLMNSWRSADPVDGPAAYDAITAHIDAKLRAAAIHPEQGEHSAGAGVRAPAAAVRAAERIDAMHKGVVGVFAAIKAEHKAAAAREREDEAQRELFEQAIGKPAHIQGETAGTMRDGDGDYENPSTQFLWELWQTAQCAAASPGDGEHSGRVLDDDTPCAVGMREAGLPAPRTCPTCKLGPCRFAAANTPATEGGK